MAGIGFYCTIVPVSFSTSTKTLIQVVAATNQRALIFEWDISFNGTSNTATPIEVDVVRQTSAGTSSALTLVKRNNSDQETLQTTGLQTFTAEPTDGGVIPNNDQIHPQTGQTLQTPFAREIAVQGGTRLGMRVVTPGAGASASARFGGDE